MDQTAGAIPVGAVSLLPLRPLVAAVNPAALEKAAAIRLHRLVGAGVMTAAVVVAAVAEEAAAEVAVTLALAAAPTKTTIARYIPSLAPARSYPTTRSIAVTASPVGL